MSSKPTNYRAYLLRLWKVHMPTGDGPANGWRASLEAPQTRERLAFATLERLFAFLLDQIEPSEAEPAQKGKEPPM